MKNKRSRTLLSNKNYYLEYIFVSITYWVNTKAKKAAGVSL